MDEGKLAVICSEYGRMFFFNIEKDDEDLAHCVYRYVIEEVYDNDEARQATDFGKGVIGYQQEEHESSRESEGEGS